MNGSHPTLHPSPVQEGVGIVDRPSSPESMRVDMGEGRVPHYMYHVYMGELRVGCLWFRDGVNYFEM